MEFTKEILESINIKEYIKFKQNLIHSYPERSKELQELHELNFIANQLNKSNIPPENINKANKLTLKQVALLLHYLRKAGIIQMNKISPDVTKQIKVISYMFGIEINTKVNSSRLYKYYNDINLKADLKIKNDYLTIENLKKVLEIVELLENKEIYLDIENKINFITLNNI